jgi:hypothetical protein
MPFLPLKLPPGVVRPGTLYDARGRWYDSQLVRWFSGTLQALGGWRSIGAVDKAVRGVHAWRTNAGLPRLALGTADGLYVYGTGSIEDITPEGLTPGSVDADSVTAAYGYGDYGAGDYGFGQSAVEVIEEATSWSMDNFGEWLVACNTTDRKIYKHEPNVPGLAEQVENSPSAMAVVVTPERFLVALGAEGDGRRVSWSDQENPTEWTPSVSNQAGHLDLADAGRILAGRRLRGETLVWTDAALYGLRYIGGALVYALQQVGAQCGAVSRHSMGVIDNRAIWMGLRGFYAYNGFVQPVPCEVADYVFNRLDRMRLSMVVCVTNAEFSEVTWYYPSVGAGENDSYVTLNVSDGSWYVGPLKRTAGVDRGVFPYPLLAGPDGALYEHEVGGSYEQDGVELVPYAESGPIELGNGDVVLHVRRLIPDERTLGSTQVVLLTAMFPTGEERTHGPYDMRNPTNVRITGRQLRVRVEHVEEGWRFGTPRLEVVGGGRR